ncbi:hypothetical protein VQ03_20140 [Methylobacterium tarhaniae]|uniref:DUF4214 domain-containing protein n=1 Tax=Methylobacterium tarhaniae TaxID=1187852 RepID=A0A0J6SSJ9_9HYPH|nr:hypothetical protein VQ03_20140 [Methylobacterium tarhaniae]
MISKFQTGANPGDAPATQREVLAGNEISTAPVASFVSSAPTNIANSSQSSIVTYSGGSTVFGTSNSDQERFIAVTDDTSMNVELGGSGPTTVATGGGNATITAASTGGTTVVGGSGTLAVNAKAGDANVVLGSGAGTILAETPGTVKVEASTGDLKFASTGSGNTEVSLGSGSAQVLTTGSGTTVVNGGTGAMAVNAVGGGAAIINASQSSNATVSTGRGDDTLIVGQGTVNADLGSGNNVVLTSAPTPSTGRSGFVASNSHDGYAVSVDGNNRIVLDDGQGHVSTLANVNVVQFSNGSTFVKASTADEAIIARMYEAVLDRTADSNGIYSWWDAYNSGQLSLQQVGSSFLNSTEAQTKGFGPGVDNTTFVTNLYHNLLERDPDGPGLQDWTSALNNGSLSRADVLISFTASIEGAATNAGSVLLSTVSGAGQDYTPHTFNVIPDGSQTVSGGAGFDVVNFAGSKSNFTTQIDLDKVTVFNAASNSTTTINHAEYIKFGDGSVMINAASTDQAVIARMYDAVLNRDADADGLHNWWAAHDNGMSLQDIAHSFLTSPEFQAQSGNLSDSAFVSLMYNNMLGRAPDQGGLENWTKELSHGMSREDLVINIAKSLEGANHSAETIKIIDHTHSF